MGNTVKFHPLTHEAIRPLGFRKDGRAIWPIMGGDDTTPPSDGKPPADPPADPPKDPAPTDPPKDGDEGKGGKDAILADLAKERDKRQALERQMSDLQASQQQQLDAIAKALGLKEDEKPDPAKLTEQLTKEQQTAREAQVQLAVYRNAADAGGDPSALLDSASFLASLKDVDPTDAQAVQAAIKAAVEASPRLAVQDGKNPPPSFGGGPRKPEPPKAAGSLGEAIRNKIANPTR